MTRMVTKLAKILDRCIAQVNKGESIKACLARYSHVREELEPLLHTALIVSDAPKIVPSDEFIYVLEKRLQIRHIENQLALEATRVSGSKLWHSGFYLAWQSLLAAITGTKRIAIPLALALLLVIGASFGAFNFLSTTPTLATQCTLTILSGNAAVQKPGADNWQGCL